MAAKTDRHPTICPCCGNDYPGDFCRTCLEDRENHDCSVYPDTREQDVPCAVCGEEHRKDHSVTIVTTGLSAGVECLSPKVRELFGIPEPEEVKDRYQAYPLKMDSEQEKVHKLFTMTAQIASSATELGIWEQHLREALDLIGLQAIPQINHNRALRVVHLDSLGKRVKFQAQSYLSPIGVVQVWIEATVDDEIQAFARFSWAEFTDPDAAWAHGELAAQMAKNLEDGETG